MDGDDRTKITLIGAGSAVFARQVMTDILDIDGLDDGEFALIDVDAARLELARGIAERLVALRTKRFRVYASTERCDLLPGSDIVINSIEVGGLANVRHDYDIPARYGVDQCIGDTIGPGGIFKALRTGPAWLAILHDCERLCPEAWVLNYTNPMSILCLAALRGTSMRTVGLCHSVQGTSRRLARYLGIPYERLLWRCGGINHLAWFTELRYANLPVGGGNGMAGGGNCMAGDGATGTGRRRSDRPTAGGGEARQRTDLRPGQDLYPLLRERAQDPAIYEQDPVRCEIMRHFGAFVTESSGHMSEYVPYFRKRPDLIAQYCRSGYEGGSGFYANTWPQSRAENDARIREMLEGSREIPRERSQEYAADIVEGLVLDRPQVIHGNVLNSGLIENLPDGCVEVACLVDRKGVQPCHFGPLPEQLAALDRSHTAVHELMVQALLQHDRQAARYALLLDPLTAAVLSPAEIERLFDEMWEAEREYLP